MGTATIHTAHSRLPSTPLIHGYQPQRPFTATSHTAHSRLPSTPPIHGYHSHRPFTPAIYIAHSRLPFTPALHTCPSHLPFTPSFHACRWRGNGSAPLASIPARPYTAPIHTFLHIFHPHPPLTPEIRTSHCISLNARHLFFRLRGSVCAPSASIPARPSRGANFCRGGGTCGSCRSTTEKLSVSTYGPWFQADDRALFESVRTFTPALRAISLPTPSPADQHTPSLRYQADTRA